MLKILWPKYDTYCLREIYWPQIKSYIATEGSGPPCCRAKFLHVPRTAKPNGCLFCVLLTFRCVSSIDFSRSCLLCFFLKHLNLHFIELPVQWLGLAETKKNGLPGIYVCVCVCTIDIECCSCQFCVRGCVCEWVSVNRGVRSETGRLFSKQSERACCCLCVCCSQALYFLRAQSGGSEAERGVIRPRFELS